MAPKQAQEAVEVVESSWWEEPVVSEVGQIEERLYIKRTKIFCPVLRRPPLKIIWSRNF
jgi:hypothetical protein